MPNHWIIENSWKFQIPKFQIPKFQIPNIFIYFPGYHGMYHGFGKSQCCS
jgi:hypothetical protein